MTTALSDPGRLAPRVRHVDDYDVEYHRGFEIKSLGGSRLGGYLVRWGSPELTDRSAEKDYFVPQTSFGRFAKGEIDVLLEHGHDREYGDVAIGSARVRPDAEGLAIVANLDLTVPAAREAMRRFEEGQLKGWSSAAVGHRVRRRAETNRAGEKVHCILAWALAEASLCATPAEPRAIITKGPKAASAAPKIMAEAKARLLRLERIIYRDTKIKDLPPGPLRDEAYRDMADAKADLGRIEVANLLLRL